jgi:predicted enzyme related to lactoylglutathione lyase
MPTPGRCVHAVEELWIERRADAEDVGKVRCWVGDLAGSIDFYSKLFGTEPAKLRPGYANFAVEEPALKLVLLEGEPMVSAYS